MQISDTRSPLPYMSSKIALSRLPRGTFVSGASKKLLHFLDPQHVGQVTMLPRVGQKLGEIILAQILSHEKPSPSSERRKLAS